MCALARFVIDVLWIHLSDYGVSRLAVNSSTVWPKPRTQKQKNEIHKLVFNIGGDTGDIGIDGMLEDAELVNGSAGEDFNSRLDNGINSDDCECVTSCVARNALLT